MPAPTIAIDSFFLFGIPLPYFFSMPAFAITSAHFATSAFSMLISSSGVLDFASTPRSGKRSWMSGRADFGQRLVEDGDHFLAAFRSARTRRSTT